MLSDSTRELLPFKVDMVACIDNARTIEIKIDPKIIITVVFKKDNQILTLYANNDQINAYKKEIDNLFALFDFYPERTDEYLHIVSYLHI